MQQELSFPQQNFGFKLRNNDNHSEHYIVSPQYNTDHIIYLGRKEKKRNQSDSAIELRSQPDALKSDKGDHRKRYIDLSGNPCVCVEGCNKWSKALETKQLTSATRVLIKMRTLATIMNRQQRIEITLII